MISNIFYPEMVYIEKMERGNSIHTFLSKIMQPKTCYAQLNTLEFAEKLLKTWNGFSRKSFIVAFTQNNLMMMGCREQASAFHYGAHHTSEEIIFHANIAHQFPNLFVYDIYFICAYHPQQRTPPPLIM